ncbi:glutamine--fructose-6-phosphate transaminase (isomerizing) [Marinibaculum pumilum]|uniref:Glutamine--fructose-6-phosphate aminotransferase [isomerizing] n=1 Tax=Marinibaculum pumilum TaxID=1766165 RepID=A0ABV7L4K7_9PROT
MCGIVAITGPNEAVPFLLEGLRRLEYRGYDSAGVATLVDGGIDRRRAAGRIDNLAEVLRTAPLAGTTGIGHTRWATHGRPSEGNAHPHATDRVALVHNGIIENYRSLRQEVVDRGLQPESETDSEVAALLLTALLREGATPEEAVPAMLARLEGAFSLAMIFAGHDGLVIGARRGSPLAIGWGRDEMFLGSDALALAPVTQRISYLEDGDWVALRADGARVHDAAGREVERPFTQSAYSGALVGKGNHAHFMHKEIHEQPTVIGYTLHRMIDAAAGRVALSDLNVDLSAIRRVQLSACGTAALAALTARHWIEGLAGIPTSWDVASELRYRAVPMSGTELGVFVSQSGETADTLGAMAQAQSAGAHTLAITNVAESSMAREADDVLLTMAGPEIGVAATKTFTCQLVALACLAMAIGRARGVLGEARESAFVQALSEVPSRINDILGREQQLVTLAETIAPARNVLYIGRGMSHPLAMEGALKLKEISYIHAEGYAAGELKHGPIALIDGSMPVIVVAPRDALFPKTLSNMEEVLARGARVLLFTDAEGAEEADRPGVESFVMPAIDPLAAPLLYAVPIQLIAYHVALQKGTDVDQPRNLAKSVTVE